MKNLLLAGFALAALSSGLIAAQAADMPLKAAPYATPAPLWSGWFFGGNVGYGWGQSTDPTFTSANSANLSAFPRFLTLGGAQYSSLNPNGVVGGLQLGYNWQTGPWVFGVVADAQASTMSASRQNTVNVAGFVPFMEGSSASIDWFGTVRGKLGWAAGSWLFYGTGGLAYGGVSDSITMTVPTGLAFVGGQHSSIKTGWAAGAGIDYAVSNYVTLGVEYLYLDLGRDTATAAAVPPFNPTTLINLDQRFAAQVVRATINWHFAP